MVLLPVLCLVETVSEGSKQPNKSYLGETVNEGMRDGFNPFFVLYPFHCVSPLCLVFLGEKTGESVTCLRAHDRRGARQQRPRLVIH